MSTYNWDAKDYEQFSQAQQKWARELIEKLKLNGGEHVLDLGCGDGKITAEIANIVKSGSVVGVDSSSAMIELAQKRYPSSNYSNLSFQVMDATKLLFAEQFDLVFSNAALHWVKNHKPIVDGLYRSLKPGGKILLQMGGKGNAEGILLILSQLQTSKEWKTYFTDFDFPYGFLGTEEYQRLLDESGFTNNRIELIPKDMEHDGVPALQGWIRSTWLPYIERIPEDKRYEFVETLSDEYIKQKPVDLSGKVHVAMVRIEVEAEKPA